MGGIRSIAFFLLAGVMLGGLACADNCNDGLGGLSDEEVRQILPQLDSDGDRDLVAFNCRDPRLSRRILLATHVGSNLGDVFLVTFAKDRAKARSIAPGHFDIVELLRDLSGNAYILVRGTYMHQGPMQTWHLLVAFRSGKTQRLAGASEDPVTGWCGNEGADPGEEQGPAAETASELNFDLEKRPDGLTNIRYKIQTKNCRTKKMTEKTLHYLPGKNGFFLEK